MERAYPMSTFALKLIAILVMLIDHVGATLISPATQPELYFVFRSIGRLAFPIFVFLIVEGFYHTKNVQKYMIRLGVFALISEIPFDLALYRPIHGTEFIDDFNSVFRNGFHSDSFAQLLDNLNQDQNVFFTLFLGLAMIYLMKQVEIRYEKQLLVSNLLDAAITIGFCLIAVFLKTDYSYAGILLFVACYLFRGSNILISLCLFVINASMCNFAGFAQTGNLLYVIQMLATFAIIPIAFYNGKKGKSAKYIFYIFYPAHLLILYFLSLII
jgi:hypothetical protein